MKVDKVKNFYYVGFVIMCCLLIINNIMRVFNKGGFNIPKERMITLPQRGTFDLPDSLKNDNNSKPNTQYNCYLFFDGRSCASCWVGKLIDIQLFFQDSLPDVKPILLFNIEDDIRSSEQRAFYESFSEFGYVVLDFDESIKNNNKWMSDQNSLSYGIITDSLNNICYCGLLFNNRTLSEIKSHYELSDTNSFCID